MWEKLPYAKEARSGFYPTRARLMASYKRCREAGLVREQDAIVDSGELQPLGATRALVISKAHAMLVDVVVASCRRIGLKIGASLAERHSGTNAVALALIHGEPIIMRGRQHFCRVFADWYCVAAPVLAPDGRVVGCVDLSTNCHARLGEKLPLVTTLAAQLGEVLSDLAADVATDDGASEWGMVSPRQRSILHLLTEGRVAKEIALSLGISQRTVESHLEKLRKRFKAKTTVELIVKLQKDAIVVEPQLRFPAENRISDPVTASAKSPHKM